MIKYVSFDVYDTLIKRTIPLHEIYDLMEKELKIDNFKNKRIKAEELAKKNCGNNYNIENIYQYFDDNLTNIDKEKIIKLEKEYEIKNSTVDTNGLYYYNKYKDKYKIICISDMFLDKKTIKKILKINGYEVYKLYVSCEENKSKKESNLYKKVINDLNINKNELLHIGDALRSDYLNPKLLGIKSKLIRNNQYNEYYYNNLGYSLFGPLIYEFCHFIYDNIEKNYKLFFVSREGDFYRKCFNILYPDIETKMIYLSRKSILSSIFGLFKKNNIDRTNLMNYISLKRNETVYDFIKRLGLNPDKYKCSLANYNIKLNDLFKSKMIDYFLECKYLKDDLLDNLELFNKYIDATLSDNNILVDIGWKGSMQNLLSKYIEITKSKKKIKGLYLGVMDKKMKDGYLFNENNDVCQNVLNYSGLLEVISMPNYGTTIGYKSMNEKIYPIFAPSEFTKNSAKIIKNIQEGIECFLNKMLLFDNKINIDKEKIIKSLNNFGNNPTLKDIKYLKKLNFYDNGISYNLVEPIKLSKLKENFLNTKWKSAYLKELLKIKLPYGKIIIWLRKKADSYD